MKRGVMRRIEREIRARRRVLGRNGDTIQVWLSLVVDEFRDREEIWILGIF
jgi:hypothetical protein